MCSSLAEEGVSEGTSTDPSSCDNPWCCRRGACGSGLGGIGTSNVLMERSAAERRQKEDMNYLAHGRRTSED